MSDYASDYKVWTAGLNALDARLKEKRLALFDAQQEMASLISQLVDAPEGTKRDDLGYAWREQRALIALLEAELAELKRRRDALSLKEPNRHIRLTEHGAQVRVFGK